MRAPVGPGRRSSGPLPRARCGLGRHGAPQGPAGGGGHAGALQPMGARALDGGQPPAGPAGDHRRVGASQPLGTRALAWAARTWEVMALAAQSGARAAMASAISWWWRELRIRSRSE